VGGEVEAVTRRMPSCRRGSAAGGGGTRGEAVDDQGLMDHGRAQQRVA
jgi:hypothetical protein